MAKKEQTTRSKHPGTIHEPGRGDFPVVELIMTEDRNEQNRRAPALWQPGSLALCRIVKLLQMRNLVSTSKAANRF
jgi:hypothetical protein